MKDKLIRVDKNGTKYFASYTCQRCGGAGGADQWTYTGWTCYECGGTGEARTPNIYKVYTPEYEAKLQERRAKREEKKRQERIKQFNENVKDVYVKYGFNENGKAYAVVSGDTYSIKDALKDAGARWFSQISRWVFTQKPEEWETVEVSFEELHEFNAETGRVYYREDGRQNFESKIVKPEFKQSEYVGEVGKRYEGKVILKAVRFWESKDPWGRPITTALYRFEQDGNIIVWKTTGFGLDSKKYPEGAEMTIRGTVKEHTEYRDAKQTVLQRVKVVE